MEDGAFVAEDGGFDGRVEDVVFRVGGGGGVFVEVFIVSGGGGMDYFYYARFLPTTYAQSSSYSFPTSSSVAASCTNHVGNGAELEEGVEEQGLF